MTKIEHTVWSILDKDKYTEEFYPQAEAMYDFIKDIVTTCGNTTKDGNTVPTMKVFFDMWNNYSGETFVILDNLVNKSAYGKSDAKIPYQRLENLTCEALQALRLDDPVNAEEFFEKTLELTDKEKELLGLDTMNLF